jgi:hypothetical protein
MPGHCVDRAGSVDGPAVVELGAAGSGTGVP